MRFLHTSDWHLGRFLYGRRRYAEFSAFLDWLLSVIETRRVDALLVAGDIFDTAAPGSRAQELYYGFLHRLSRQTCCRHAVIIAGNHDSPRFIDAPRGLLRASDIHVVGAADPVSEEEKTGELVLLGDPDGEVEAVVCAVPYLRDSDIRSSEPGESLEDKSRKLAAGMRGHYAALFELARREQRRSKRKIPPPLIAMGHLFAAGGRTVGDDGVRELYVGGLDGVDAGIFPPEADYVALGHLHIPQTAGGREECRYSGSPLMMGFGEYGREKSVVLIDFDAGKRKIETLPVPVFQRIERIRGGLDRIASRLEELKGSPESVWISVEYDGERPVDNLKERIEELSCIERNGGLFPLGSGAEIINIKNSALCDRIMGGTDPDNSDIGDVSPSEVFARCLDRFGVENAEERAELTAAHNRIANAVLSEGTGKKELE